MRSAVQLVALASSLALSAHGQTVLQEWTGERAGDQLGFSVAPAGDMDQDGTPDVVLGAPYHGNQTSGDKGGLVWVRSGLTGKVLFRYVGDGGMSDNGFLGWSVDGGRDTNGDGVPEFVIGGASGAYYNWGTVTLISGATGLKHWQKWGTLSNGTWFPGWQVLMIDSVDGNAFAEVVSTDPWAASGVLGRVRTWNGISGSTLYTQKGTQTNLLYGWSVGRIGDVSGDGRPDLVVGAPHQAGGTLLGEVELLNAVDGSPLLKIVAGEAGAEFGHDTTGIDDFDGDGTPDVLIGAPHASGGEGRAYVHSGASGARLLTLSGSGELERFGHAVAAAGDFDGDGVDDWLVGAPDSDALTAGGGRVTVYSGVDATVLATFLGDRPGGALGWSFAFVGDVDGGGLEDLLLGEPLNHAGRALLLRTERGAEVYCTAKLNSNACLPRLEGSGTPSLTQSDYTVGATQLVNGQVAFLFWGTAGSVANPFMGGTKCVLNPVTRVPHGRLLGIGRGGLRSGLPDRPRPAPRPDPARPALVRGPR